MLACSSGPVDSTATVEAREKTEVLTAQRQRPGDELDESNLAFFLPCEAAQKSHHPAVVLSVSRAWTHG